MPSISRALITSLVSCEVAGTVVVVFSVSGVELVIPVCTSLEPRVVVDGFFAAALRTGLGRCVSFVKYFE